MEKFQVSIRFWRKRIAKIYGWIVEKLWRRRKLLNLSISIQGLIIYRMLGKISYYKLLQAEHDQFGRVEPRTALNGIRRPRVFHKSVKSVLSRLQCRARHLSALILLRLLFRASVKYFTREIYKLRTNEALIKSADLRTENKTELSSKLYYYNSVYKKADRKKFISV